MILNVKKLKIHFRHDNETVKAVDGIDFAISENEVLGLVGESGSGKTVTALSVMNLLPKTDCVQSGEIARNSRIAMIFQEPFTCLNPVLRVGEQIDEAVMVRDKITKKDAKEKTLALLEKVKIEDPQRIYDSYPHLLSGGQRQRAMIAMALGLSPGLLIADEPTTALDVTIQAEILDLILSLKKELGMSVLFITHDFGIIDKVADRVLVMKEGEIVERGPKDAVLSSPKADYTKKLLDAVPRMGTGLDPTLYPPDERPVPIVINVKNLSKKFAVEKGIFRKVAGYIQAVHNVNLEIKEAKTLGVVGESGSGKTTLAKLLVGLLKADSGTMGTGLFG
ncbi:MAG: ATP-binding cassette domain-containing protein, partial [Candidatus Omnitrophota bacterium]